MDNLVYMGQGVHGVNNSNNIYLKPANFLNLQEKVVKQKLMNKRPWNTRQHTDPRNSVWLARVGAHKWHHVMKQRVIVRAMDMMMTI